MIKNTGADVLADDLGTLSPIPKRYTVGNDYLFRRTGIGLTRFVVALT